jgi:hypothetical protein
MQQLRRRIVAIRGRRGCYVTSKIRVLTHVSKTREVELRFSVIRIQGHGLCKGLLGLVQRYS